MKSLIIILTISLFVLPAQAEYSGGTGEPNDPYQKIWNDRPLIVKVVISR